jgi:hypothetical protein
VNPHLLDAVMYVLAAVLVAVSPFVVAIAVQGARYITTKLHITMSAEQEQKLTRALEAGVAQAAAKLRNVADAGDRKKSAALATARSIAPKAFDGLSYEQQEALVEATYVKLRPSLQTPSMLPTNPPPAGSASSSGNWQPITPSMLSPEMLRGNVPLPNPAISPKDDR